MEESRPRTVSSSSGSVNGWLVAILLILGVALFIKMSGGISSPLHNPDAQPRVVTARGDLAADEQSQIELFRTASPSVVHVTSMTIRRDRFSLNLYEIPKGSGSGFIWDKSGYVVTNFHVIEGARGIRVALADNSTWDARVAGVARHKDLAVLKIDAPADRLKKISIGRSDDLQVGQNVFAIGDPFGLDHTLTTGVISGLGRDIPTTSRYPPIRDGIQTDAAINPGNSGGPLLDSAGRLIGVNTAIISPSGAYAGVGFAVPVDTVRLIVPQLISTGEVARPGMGIHIFPDAVVNQLRSRGVLSAKGVLVLGVVEGGAADKAGIRPSYRDADGQIVWGDLIIAIDGETVESSPHLFQHLENRKVGDAITVTVIRNDEELNLPLTLQSLPSME